MSKDIKITLFTKDGAKKGTADVPTELANPGSLALLAQALHVYQDRRHPGTKDTKTRAEVDITKKKIYKQKGTGGARHGAASAPIFSGGGVAHGPKPNKKILTLPQASRVRASQVALAEKQSLGRVVAVEGISDLVKTADAQKIKDFVSKELDYKAKGYTLFVLRDQNSTRAIKNLKNVKYVIFNQLNAFDIYHSAIIILDASLMTKEKPKAKVTAKKGKKA